MESIHDFHNGGQLGKNGNCNIRARPVMPQQNKYGRVINVGRVASLFFSKNVQNKSKINSVQVIYRPCLVYSSQYYKGRAINWKM